MGLGGTLEYISDIMSSDKPKKKKKQFNTVELKVRMDCDGCELKVKNAVFHEWSEISGDKQETTKGDSNRICGSKQGVKEGKVNREEGRDMAICPLQLGCPAYAAQSYDKKAPPGYVRRVEQNPTTGTVARFDDPAYVTMFIDDNPNTCSVM